MTDIESLSDDAACNPDDGERLYHIARELMEKGEYSAAVTFFRRSAEIHPHFKTLELLGECLVRQGLYQDAIIPLAAATTMNQQAIAPTLLAQVYLKLDDICMAQRMAKEAMRRNSNYRQLKELMEEIDREIKRIERERE